MKIDPRRPSRCPECDAEFTDPARIKRHFFETHLVTASATTETEEGTRTETANGR